MAKSKSFFGLRRGSTKSHTYQVNYGQQITKDRVSSVRNPRTTAQVMQRMKMNNARLFYNALNTASARGVINHSFEGVAYHDPTRRAFMSLAMKKAGGPYVPRGVMQWIPGDYQVSRGSLPAPSLTISTETPTAGEGQTLITIQSGDTLTAAQVALFNQLGVASGAQISIVCVLLNGAVYEPIAFEFKNQEGETIEDTDAGWMLYILTNTATGAVVSASLNVGPYAGCIIISQQDAGGKWLRSPSKMWISADIREEYYTPGALQAAIESYQQEQNANALNSAYFLNQSSTRAYNGSIIALTAVSDDGTTSHTFIAGMLNIDGKIRYQYITSDGTVNGNLIGTDGNSLGVTAASIDGWLSMDDFTQPAASSGFGVAVEYKDAMLQQGGF